MSLHPVPSDFPGRVTLELTNKCNISCTFCPRKIMEKNLGSMDLSLAKRLLDEISGHLPVSLVPFFRGEPLLHPDWYEILRYAKMQGIGPLQFTTNATLMDKDVARALIDLQLDFISFSLDTVDPDLYEQTRRGSDYNIVHDNILYLLQLKYKHCCCFPEVQISAVDTPLHHAKLDDFVSYWRPKVDRVRIYIEHSQDGNPGSIALPLPEFERRLPCYKLFTDMVIYWNGEVSLCNHDWNRLGSDRLGDVNKQTIAEVWCSEKYNELRSLHQAGNVQNIHPCTFCDHWKMYYIEDGFLGKIYPGTS